MEVMFWSFYYLFFVVEIRDKIKRPNKTYNKEDRNKVATPTQRKEMKDRNKQSQHQPKEHKPKLNMKLIECDTARTINEWYEGLSYHIHLICTSSES